jgi:hypothetical protein
MSQLDAIADPKFKSICGTWYEEELRVKTCIEARFISQLVLPGVPGSLVRNAEPPSYAC